MSRHRLLHLQSRILRCSVQLGIAACAVVAIAADGKKPPETAPAVQISGKNGQHQWTFSRNDDADFDDTPDRWKRQRDREHPAYLPIKIQPWDDSLQKLGQSVDQQLLTSWETARKYVPALPALPPSAADLITDRYLRMELDGGWAMLTSPLVAVDPLYRYRLELKAKTEDLVFNHARAELVFLDATGKPVAQFDTKSLTGTSPWTKLSTELVAVPNLAVSATVRLMVRSIKSAGETDIRGAAGFDDITIQQLPQIRVSTDQRLAIYDEGQQPSITVQVLGMKRDATDVRFDIRDINGQVVASQLVLLDELESKQSNGGTAPGSSIEGVATWQLPVLQPGFYVAQTMLGGANSKLLSNETTLAILADLPKPKLAGPYGWTLPSGSENETDFKRMPDWLSRLGVGVVKYPCWFAPDDRIELDAAAWFVNRLQERNIRVIGLLDKPPEIVRLKIDERERREPVATNFFRDAAVWQPMLEPIMTRLTLKVRTWQIGADTDFSFIGSTKLRQTIKDIGRELQGFGQPVGIAFSWPWLEMLPPSSEQSWAAINLSTAAQPLSVDELEAYLQATETTESVARERAETWVSLDPLNVSSYDLPTRITDLVLRMTAVRGHRVPASFASDLLSPGHGLLRPDWRPNELLLPWRTAAMLLGDLTKAGSLPLPGKSDNTVLTNSDRTTIVVWNPSPTTEAMFLGDSVRQIDVWGRSKKPKTITVDGRTMQEFEVGPVPTFLVDTDPVLVAFQMSTRLFETRIDSLLGQRQSLTIEFANPTQEALSGEVRMQRLADWEVDLEPQTFDLAPGRTASHSFDVSLRNSAKIGSAQLQFEFLLTTQPQRRFTVARSIHVGPEGLDLEINTRIVKDELLVDLTMENQTDRPQTYDCMLFPPGDRQYQRRQIILPARTTIKRTFPWPNGKSLVGKEMLLRAVEQDGDRVLNQVVNITE